MNIDELTFSFNTVQWFLVAAIGIYAWFIGRLSASAKDVADLRLRIATIETQLKSVPEQNTVTEIRVQLQKLDAEMDSNNRELKAINASVNRISDYLLKVKS